MGVQVYSITRTDFYKKLKKNKNWNAKRIDFGPIKGEYIYGCELSKGHEKIIIEPQITDSKTRTFIFTYENSKSPEKNINQENIKIESVQMLVNKIMYDNTF